MAQDNVTRLEPRANIAPSSGQIFRWESRSSEELKEIVARGLQGGASFDAARLELERRAAEALQSQAAVKETQAARDARRRWTAITAIAILVFVVPLILLVLGF